MQLKLRRSQRDGGMMGKTAVFCLDARVEFTKQERDSLVRYKLLNQVIYNSDASRRLIEKSEAQQDGSVRGNLKSLASVALAAMRLNITVAGLEKGQHIECKSLDELLGAEDAVHDACRNLRGYLDTAATFDGREILVRFDAQEEPAVVAAPPPRLLEARPAPAQALPAPAQEYAAEPGYEESYTATSASSYDAGSSYAAPTEFNFEALKKPLIFIAVAFIIFLFVTRCMR